MDPPVTTDANIVAHSVDVTSDDSGREPARPDETRGDSAATETIPKIKKKKKKRKKHKSEKRNKRSSTATADLTLDDDDAMSHLKPDDIVEITGLAVSTSLNGRRGRVVRARLPIPSGCVAVILDGSTDVVSITEHDDEGCVPVSNLRFPDARKAWSISPEDLDEESQLTDQNLDLPGVVNEVNDAEENKQVRKTFGVLNASGFREVSERAIQHLNEENETTPLDSTIARQLGGTGMVRMWFDRLIGKILDQSVTLLFGFVIGHQLFVGALFRDEDYTRLVQTYSLMSQLDSALVFFFATFACTNVVERALHSRELGKPVSPSLAIAATCIVIVLILTLYSARYEIDLGRYHSFECNFQQDCPDDKTISTSTKDATESWYKVNLARTFMTVMCGVVVVLGQSTADRKLA